MKQKERDSVPNRTGMKTLRSSQHLNLSLLNASQIFLPTEPLELWTVVQWLDGIPFDTLSCLPNSTLYLGNIVGWLMLDNSSTNTWRGMGLFGYIVYRCASVVKLSKPFINSAAHSGC